MLRRLRHVLTGSLIWCQSSTVYYRVHYNVVFSSRNVVLQGPAPMARLAAAALVALVCWLSSAAVPAASSAAALRHPTRRLQTEDVPPVSARQRSHATALHGSPHPLHRRPVVGHSHPPQRHRSPPDPRAPELTAVQTHHSRWFQQHRAAATPSPAHSSASRPHSAPHSRGHGQTSPHSAPQRPTGQKPSRKHGASEHNATTQPPPPTHEKLRKVRIQPCSVDHGSAGEVQVRLNSSP